jgi:hypothetical protein
MIIPSAAACVKQILVSAGQVVVIYQPPPAPTIEKEDSEE